MKKPESSSGVSTWRRVGLFISGVLLCTVYATLFGFRSLRLSGMQAAAVAGVVMWIVGVGTIASTFLMWLYAIKQEPWRRGRRSFWFILQAVLILGPWTLIGIFTLIFLVEA
ncbi:hypothetical protein [Stenotrophomonas sp.]|uniref:hypothetical protein n=1 Tax=Stenotrophomonas sp. TaxID=69392 RepID=UPI0028B0AC63|nr:hypothetical protein [Stenotrophomonas sp.]